MSRYTGPVRITYSGNRDICAKYISEGRKYLGGLFDIKSIPSLTRKITNIDGVTFVVAVVGTQPQLHIDARYYKKGAEHYATVLYYFDTTADVLRGIDVDTGNEVVNISGFTAMSVMTLHPNNKWLFCSASVGASNYANVVIDLELYAANAFTSPILSTADRPNNRPLQPVIRRISKDGNKAVVSYAVTADPTTNAVIEGFGAVCIMNITPVANVPTYTLAHVIERGRANGRPEQPIEFVSDTEFLIHLNSDANGATLPLPPGASDTIYERVRRVSLSAVNNGYVDYASGEYEPGFWPGNAGLQIAYKNETAYTLFRYSVANNPNSPPYRIATNKDLEIIDTSTGVVNVGGLDFIPTTGSSERFAAGIAVPRYSSYVFAQQRDGVIHRIDVGTPSAPVLEATGSIDIAAGTVTGFLSTLGPTLADKASEDNRFYVGYQLTAGSYLTLIFTVDSISGMVNSGTIAPYKAISMPGFNGARESVVLKRELRQANDN